MNECYTTNSISIDILTSLGLSFFFSSFCVCFQVARCLFSCHSPTKKWWFASFYFIRTNQLYHQHSTTLSASLFAAFLFAAIRFVIDSYWRKQISIEDVFVHMYSRHFSSFSVSLSPSPFHEKIYFPRRLKGKIRVMRPVIGKFSPASESGKRENWHLITLSYQIPFIDINLLIFVHLIRCFVGCFMVVIYGFNFSNSW